MAPRKNSKTVSNDTATQEVSNPEHEKLIEVLKFTPRTYKLYLWGYGGELVIGEITKKVWDYFRDHKIDVGDYAWDSDYGDSLEVPEDCQPFYPGSWHDCDNLYHGWGVSTNAGTLEIQDENGEVVYTRELDKINGTEVQLACGEEAWVQMKGSNSYVFYNYSSEKGTFFEAEIELTAPFDPEKLCLTVDDVEGDELVTSVSYDDEQLDNYGGDTNGKGSDFKFIHITDDGDTEIYADGSDVDEDFDDGTPPSGPSPSDWERSTKFKGVNPVHTGWYHCNYAQGSTFGSLYWNGEKNVWEDYYHGRVSRTYDSVDWWYGYNWDTSNWDNRPSEPVDAECKKKGCGWTGWRRDMREDDDYNSYCPLCNGTEWEWIDYDPSTAKGRKNRAKHCKTESVANILARAKQQAGIKE